MKRIPIRTHRYCSTYRRRVAHTLHEDGAHGPEKTAGRDREHGRAIPKVRPARRRHDHADYYNEFFVYRYTSVLVQYSFISFFFLFFDFPYLKGCKKSREMRLYRNRVFKGFFFGSFFFSSLFLSKTLPCLVFFSPAAPLPSCRGTSNGLRATTPGVALLPPPPTAPSLPAHERAAAFAPPTARLAFSLPSSSALLQDGPTKSSRDGTDGACCHAACPKQSNIAVGAGSWNC